MTQVLNKDIPSPEVYPAGIEASVNAGDYETLDLVGLSESYALMLVDPGSYEEGSEGQLRELEARTAGNLMAPEEVLDDEDFMRAYKMAALAVRIAQGAGGNPEGYIGEGDEIKDKARQLVALVSGNLF